MVTQLGDIYTPGSAPHKCVPKCAALPAARIQAQIRETANSETFTPASSIVNDALQAYIYVYIHMYMYILNKTNRFI